MPRQSLLTPINVGAIGERWQIDLSGPYPVSNGFKYICVCIEAFSQWVVAVPIRDKTATAVAKVLVKDVITKYGIFQSLLSDNGGEFINALVQDLCKLLHIDQLRITSYRPSGNGRCEIMNRTLHALLAKVISETQKDWSDYLPHCVWAYNISRHSSTGFSPFFLMHGRLPYTPIDLLLNRSECEGETLSYHEFAQAAENGLRYAFQKMQQVQGPQTERMKRYYNVTVKPKVFKEGDFVYYYYPRKVQGRCLKWQKLYTGVFRIIRRINDAVYVIRRTPQSKPIVSNIDKLKLYIGETPVAWEKAVRLEQTRQTSAGPPDSSGGTQIAQPTLPEHLLVVPDSLVADSYRDATCQNLSPGIDTVPSSSLPSAGNAGDAVRNAGNVSMPVLRPFPCDTNSQPITAEYDVTGVPASGPSAPREGTLRRSVRPRASRPIRYRCFRIVNTKNSCFLDCFKMEG